jgi:hypothetical protein
MDMLSMLQGIVFGNKQETGHNRLVSLFNTGGSSYGAIASRLGLREVMLGEVCSGQYIISIIIEE